MKLEGLVNKMGFDKTEVLMTVWAIERKVFKIKCPSYFTIFRYTFWDPVSFDEKSMIQAILRYIGHPKWTKSQI